jgi:hypothetical protein
MVDLGTYYPQIRGTPVLETKALKNVNHDLVVDQTLHLFEAYMVNSTVCANIFYSHARLKAHKKKSSYHKNNVQNTSALARETQQ